jgi:hypothetical protein
MTAQTEPASAGLRVAGLRSVPAAMMCCGLLLCATAHPAAAQTNLQLWGDLSLNWLRSDRLSYALDLEPQALVANTDPDSPGWRTFGATPNVEYSAKRWLDVIAELGTGITHQTDGLRSFELTPRAGLRFYVFSRDLPTVIGRRLNRVELPPTRRLILRDRLLVEQRNLFYNQGEPTSSTVRVRNRIEFQFALNRSKATDDGSRTLLADWEWFLPLGDPAERFASRQRIRSGFAFRHNFTWRSELVYLWTRSRDTTDEAFSTSDNAISFTVRRYVK